MVLLTTPWSGVLSRPQLVLGTAGNIQETYGLQADMCDVPAPHNVRAVHGLYLSGSGNGIIVGSLIKKKT